MDPLIKEWQDPQINAKISGPNFQKKQRYLTISRHPSPNLLITKGNINI